MTAVQGAIERAARGILPDWTEATERRRAHMERVAGLLETWAIQMGLDTTDRVRWKAAGWLHDTLRDAPVERLRPWVVGPLARYPAAFLHGPATAARLEAEGCTDHELLEAIRYHTVSHPSLGLLGRALIAADYLEPGRKSRSRWRAGLRALAPSDFDAVFRAVVRAKIERSLEAGTPLGIDLVELWNTLTGT